jgi:hypothetical protein
MTQAPKKVPPAPIPGESVPSTWRITRVGDEVFEFYNNTTQRTFIGPMSELNAIINPKPVIEVSQ